MPRVNPPAIRLRPLVVPGPPSPMESTSRTMIARPNRPYTIDGTPARLRMLVRMIRVNRLSEAYSSR